MGLTGLDAIQKMRGAILELPKLMSQASTDAAHGIEEAIHEQFASGTDPFGNPWEALRPSTLRRGRTPPPGTDTGALAAVHVTPLQGAGVRVEFDEEYASYFDKHRQLAPDAATFARSTWYKPVVEAYSNAILKNGGWRAAGASVEDELLDQAAE